MEAAGGTSVRVWRVGESCRRARWPVVPALLAALVAGATSATPRLAAGARLDDPVESGSVLLRVFRDSDGLPQNTVHAGRRGVLQRPRLDGRQPAGPDALQLRSLYRGGPAR